MISNQELLISDLVIEMYACKKLLECMEEKMEALLIELIKKEKPKKRKIGCKTGSR